MRTRFAFGVVAFLLMATLNACGKAWVTAPDYSAASLRVSISVVDSDPFWEKWLNAGAQPLGSHHDDDVLVVVGFTHDCCPNDLAELPTGLTIDYTGTGGGTLLRGDLPTVHNVSDPAAPIWRGFGYWGWVPRADTMAFAYHGPSKKQTTFSLNAPDEKQLPHVTITDPSKGGICAVPGTPDKFLVTYSPSDPARSVYGRALRGTDPASTHFTTSGTKADDGTYGADRPPTQRDVGLLPENGRVTLVRSLTLPAATSDFKALTASYALGQTFDIFWNPPALCAR